MSIFCSRGTPPSDHAPVDVMIENPLSLTNLEYIMSHTRSHVELSRPNILLQKRFMKKMIRVDVCPVEAKYKKRGLVPGDCVGHTISTTVPHEQRYRNLPAKSWVTLHHPHVRRTMMVSLAGSDEGWFHPAPYTLHLSPYTMHPMP